MTDKHTSAFPIHPEVNVVFDERFCGMTLRDYFAAKAIQSMLSAGIYSAQYDDDAEQAYVVADAMLKARNGET
jgi:hypothetical protein